MTMYTCGEKQNPEKVSDLKRAAKNFFVASKELGVALGHEGEKFKNKAKIKVKKFMAENPRVAGAVGAVETAPGSSLLVLAGIATLGATSYVNSEHAVAQSTMDQIDILAQAAPVYAIAGGMAVAGALIAKKGGAKVNRLYKHAKDNHWAWKARVAIRKQVRERPELHKFLIAANQKINNGLQFVKEFTGGR